MIVDIASSGTTCRRASLDALVVTALPNILYLTNFTGSTAIAVVTPARVHFLTDFRYVTAIADSRGTAHECPNLDLVTVEGSYDASLAELLASKPLQSSDQRCGSASKRRT